ncbi:putative athila retroelement ORF1 protein [Trifolium medium]|uniref:Putative athila retroelement ORF1 protein n=1 Tax=Trifolium medium TaxID=97028 RepID=A0A392M3V8_9FABA|nr:putative athila retroelement ORF1 protein [Trifolium medium]
MAGEDSVRNIMGNYFKITDPEEVTQGFQPVNPTTLDVKKVVMKELKRNQFKGDDSQDPWDHLINFQEACALQKQPNEITDDQKKLFLFSYLLTKKAKDWLYCLPTGPLKHGKI